jgi:hypothetical protein
MTKPTNAAPLRWFGGRASGRVYLFMGSVHLSHIERRLSLSHFLDNALHFLDNAFFGRPPVALVDSRYIA